MPPVVTGRLTATHTQTFVGALFTIFLGFVEGRPGWKRARRDHLAQLRAVCPAGEADTAVQLVRHYSVSQIPSMYYRNE